MQLGFASELAALSAVARPRIPFLILNCALLNFNHLKSDIVVTFTNGVGAASEALIPTGELPTQNLFAHGRDPTRIDTRH